MFAGRTTGHADQPESIPTIADTVSAPVRTVARVRHGDGCGRLTPTRLLTRPFVSPAGLAPATPFAPGVGRI